MMPWGHVGAGYLLYTWYSVYKPNLDPHSGALATLLFGTQFPDLIDKPLGWTFDILPSGRSLAHSLITATIVIVLTLYIADRLGQWYLGTAFSIGYLSHLATDSLQPAIKGQEELLTNLGWPILSPPAYGEEKGITAHFTEIQSDISQGQVGIFFWLQIILFVAAIVVAVYIEWARR